MQLESFVCSSITKATTGNMFLQFDTLLVMGFIATLWFLVRDFYKKYVDNSHCYKVYHINFIPFNILGHYYSIWFVCRSLGLSVHN